MRKTICQTGNYNVVAVASRNNDTFKVDNVRKEMVFRAKDTESRDDWLNRFSLGQIKNRSFASNIQMHIRVYVSMHLLRWRRRLTYA